ncbi:MAG: hypothetical protein ACLFPJ_04785 [Candidatus Woesearchaeota archaeon]
MKEDTNKIILKFNPTLYPLEIIYSASYKLVEKALFYFDGDLEKEIKVIIIPKKGFNAKKISLEFHEELINNLEYKTYYDKNKDIKHILLQSGLNSYNN